MNKIIHYIKRNFEQPQNGLMKLIIVHTLCFLALVLVRIICMVSFQIPVMEQFVKKFLYLNSGWTLLIYRPWSLLTYLFTEEGLGTLCYNLYTLYTFGQIIVYLLGSQRLVRLYLGGGILGGLTIWSFYQLAPLTPPQVILPTSQIVLNPATYAVIIGTVSFAPNFSLYFFVWRIEIKYIGLCLLAWTLIQLSDGHLQVISQLGSALWAYTYMSYLRYQDTLHSQAKDFYSVVIDRLKKIFTWQTNTAPKASASTQKKVEVLLDKIAKKGYDSLSYEEKQQLFQAGE